MRGGKLVPTPGARFALRVPPRKLRVLETHRLSPHADVCLFAHEGREYLVVLSAAGANVLREREAPGGDALT
jgi:hypothetical protein